jgi:hypothetical protein
MSKTFIKCKSYRELKKVIRKYGLRMYKRNHRSFWCPWCDYTIYDKEEANKILNNILSRKHLMHYIGYGNFIRILKEFVKDYHKECRGMSGESGILYGINITNEDYYYVIKRKDKSMVYESCCSKFNILE